MIGAINPVRHTPAEAPPATAEFQEEMRTSGRVHAELPTQCSVNSMPTSFRLSQSVIVVPPFSLLGCLQEVPAVPRTLHGPSLEHGLKLCQVWVAGDQKTHATNGPEINRHTQLRAAVARKRKREVIRLQRLRQDNPAAKVVFVGTCGAHGLSVMKSANVP